MGGISKRQEIVAAADQLFYQAGFAATSFADVATEVGISRGNFYYHFKAKDDLLAAVIDHRLERTRQLLIDWELHDSDPVARLQSFVDIMTMNRAKIVAYGCPVGTLCSELAKLEHGLQGQARQLFELFRDWLARQFRLLRVADPEVLAMQLLAQSQGAATLAQAFGDAAYLAQEVQRMKVWVARQVA